MSDNRKGLFLIKLTCWLGIIADALWAIGLFVPSLYGLLVGISGFVPDLHMRLAMGIGGSLMAGWTLLLLWLLMKPIERRIVFLLTAFPVLVGLFTVALVDFMQGNRFVVWILVKSAILFVMMVMSFVISRNISKEGP